jgi:hypothetical protein
MDKSTLSSYGWIIVLTLVLSVMFVLATPFGVYVGQGASALIKYYRTFTSEYFTANHIDAEQQGWEEKFDPVIPPSEIEANPRIYGIGKTKSEYVLAIFNEDYTKVNIVKNGEDSDGLMMDFGKEMSAIRKYGQNLQVITVEEGVVSIGKNSCRNLQKLRKVYLPKSLKIIEYASFNYCQNLEKFDIPEGVEYIGGYSLIGAGKLTDLHIPSTVNRIDEAAIGNLYRCENITVAENNPYYTSIDGAVYTKDLKTLVQYPSGKRNVVFDMPDSVTHIMGYAVAENYFLEKIVLHEGLEKIDVYGCYHMLNLKELNLPSTLTAVGPKSFCYCWPENAITIPKGLTKIDVGAFAACGTEFIVEDGHPNFKTIDGVLFSKDGSTLINYPARNTNKTYVVPENTKEIQSTAFIGLKHLENITIADGITQINDGTFGNAAGQKFVVTIPDSVTSISTIAFLDCRNPTIRCHAGTTAETFALTNQIKCTIIE